MLKLNHVIGTTTDPDLAELLHELEHQHRVEYIALNSEDIKRRRLRVFTDQGTDCAIQLERDTVLQGGSILLLEAERAIAIRLLDIQWLRLKPKSVHAALKLGYFAGNLHWQVEIDGDVIKVAIAGSEQAYLNQLQSFLESGEVEQITHD